MRYVIGADIPTAAGTVMPPNMVTSDSPRISNQEVARANLRQYAQQKGALGVLITTLVGGGAGHLIKGKDGAVWGYIVGAIGGYAYQHIRTASRIVNI